MNVRSFSLGIAPRRLLSIALVWMFGWPTIPPLDRTLERDRAKDKLFRIASDYFKTKNQLEVISSAIGGHVREYGQLPRSLKDLAERLPGAMRVDLWGREFAYRIEGDGMYDVRSLGEDGLVGTSDDVIGGWED